MIYMINIERDNLHISESGYDTGSLSTALYMKLTECVNNEPLDLLQMANSASEMVSNGVHHLEFECGEYRFTVYPARVAA